MTPLQLASNPFALMIDPETIFAAVANSDRLQRLQSRVCRPLDKIAGSASEVDESDQDADGRVDEASDDAAE